MVGMVGMVGMRASLGLLFGSFRVSLRFVQGYFGGFFRVSSGLLWEFLQGYFGGFFSVSLGFLYMGVSLGFLRVSLGVSLGFPSGFFYIFH